MNSYDSFHMLLTEIRKILIVIIQNVKKNHQIVDWYFFTSFYLSIWMNVWMKQFIV